jgi:hypothetical protein
MMYIYSLYDQVLRQFIIRNMQLMSPHSQASTSGKRLIDRCFTSGAHYSICSTSIYWWRIFKYAPLIIFLLVAQIVQNAPPIFTWDPPEGTCQGYVWRIMQYAPLIIHISVAHIQYAPLIIQISMAHIEYAPRITWFFFTRHTPPPGSPF